MYSFKMQVAAQIVQIETIYSYSRAACRRFLTEGEAAFAIRISEENIAREKQLYAAVHGDAAPDDRIEFIAVHRKLSEELIAYDTFTLHGAAVSLDGRAYVFCGRSGVGKSTHILKWVDHIPRTVVVNGDKPFVWVGGKDVMICGSPWAGKEGMTENTAAPLRAAVFLERAEKNRIQKISLSEAFPFLYQQVYLPEDRYRMRKTLQMLKSLDGRVSFYRFFINNMEDDCFQAAYDALVKGNAP